MSVKIAEKLERDRPYRERRISLGPGVVWFSNPDLGTGLCFPIKKLGYRARLSGPTAAVEGFLTFVNPTAENKTAYFLFPLDRGTAPVKIRGKVGHRQFETELGPAPQDDSEEEGRLELPAELSKLFQEETENILAIPLGEVPANGEVSFQLLLAQMAYDVGDAGMGFSFRLPLLCSRALTTLNPSDTGQYELAKGLDRGAQVAISIQIEASDLQPGRIVASQTCAVARNPNGDLAVEFDRRKPLEAKDFVLDYQLWAGPRPKAWLRSQGRHFLLNFFPPGQPTPSAPRRLVILVDGSEEMSRIGDRRCKDFLSYILKNLAPEDRFALVTFSREVSGYKNGDFVEAGLAAEALQWMDEYQFGGGADLNELLRRVITLPRQADSVLSVVVVAAGRIGNEPQLYRLLQGSRDILRLFPVLLGPKADPHFARAAARLTGGFAFRPLNLEAVPRAAQRVLEHSRQPVLEGVGFQDKGLQYQGESLTPKYPSGLNWMRPITVMGAHSGRGGLEASGTGPGGVGWSEFCELKPVFHKVLANVWAQVKASELDDEAQMLDRAERTILQNVIRNLSREFQLFNRFTAVLIKSSDGSVDMAPPIEAASWYRRIEKELHKGKSANELLEEQKHLKDLKSGLSKRRAPGKGLRMKENIGKQGTAPLFESKIGHRNKLAPNIKEGLFNKPVLKSRKDGLTDPSTGSNKPFFPSREASPMNGPGSEYGKSAKKRAPEVAAPRPVKPPEPAPSLESESMAPLPDPVSPSPRTTESPVPEFVSTVSEAPPTPERGERDGGPDFSERPTTRLDGGRPEIPEIPATSGAGDSLDPTGPGQPTKPISVPEFARIRPQLSSEDSLGVEEEESREDDPSHRPVMGSGLPTIGMRPMLSEPPSIEPGPAVEMERTSSPQETPVESGVPVEEPPGALDPTQPTKKLAGFAKNLDEARSATLPTARELAAKVTPEAMQGNPIDTAKSALRQDPMSRKTLMAEMKMLHTSLGELNDAARLTELTDAILFRLADIAPKAKLLVQAYDRGYKAREALQANTADGKQKLKVWLSQFAKLF